MAVVHTLYYTDPFCPWSWAQEPALRRLLWELGDALRIGYVMCGMRRELEDPRQLAVQALNASEPSGMPVDARGFLVDPAGSSHPACIAVVAAAEQGEPGPYLRRLREGIFCRRRKLDNADALAAEAQAIPGIDLARFRVDLGSHATLERFGADLERAQGVDPQHRAEGSDRVKLPSVEFLGADGAVQGVYGISSYDELRDAALAAGAEIRAAEPPSIREALGRFPSMATAEVASVCRLRGPRAPAELWRLSGEWQVRAERTVGGELWSLE
jgi:putative protein-disulfide isomerase